MLVSRFLLDLRSVYLADHGQNSIKPPSSIRFAESIIGNIGAPLETSLVFNAGDEEELYEKRAVYSNDPLSFLLETESVEDSNGSSYVYFLLPSL